MNFLISLFRKKHVPAFDVRRATAHRPWIERQVSEQLMLGQRRAEVIRSR